MKIAYFDCLAGASGDMILGALVDAGLPLESLRERLSILDLDEEFELKGEKVSKNGFAATRVDVIPYASHPSDRKEHFHERRLTEFETILRKSRLPVAIQDQATGMFRRLAEVEAGIHGQLVEQQVHLHEIGGVSTMVKVVGALLGLEALGIEQAFSSPLPLGRGFVTGPLGQVPLPSPGTLALLKGVPVQGREIDQELVTSTGALILTTVCQGFGPVPSMTLTGLGYGAGEPELPIPNILRLLIGETGTGMEQMVLLETNLDDNSGEINGYVMEKLFATGALDVFFLPIQMKKNRLATMLSVLCRPADTELLEAILFRETSTLGVRRQFMEMHYLERNSKIVETLYGPVRVKVARLPDETSKRAPEYEDCKKAAETHGVPLRTVYAAALSIQA
jgi:pyridinium-3,5-bisthiocarboxylic acid mononucleotide nickel chelatase